MPEFKDMLKLFRMREHLSQSELAEKLGISASSISMYEVGKREPDFETEEKIADFFNTDLNTLRGKDTEVLSESDPEIRRIQRARQKMPPQDKEFMMEMLRRSFSQYFGDDGADDPD